MSKLPSLQELIDAPRVERKPKSNFLIDESRPANQNDLQKFLFTKNTSKIRKGKEELKAKARKTKKAAVKDEDGKPIFAASTKERARKVMKKVENILEKPAIEERKAKEKMEREEEKAAKKAEAKAKRDKTKENVDKFKEAKKAEEKAAKEAKKAEEKAAKEAAKAAKPKRKARFEKGSPEALAFGQRMKELKAAKKAAAAAK
jgi:hypothetical protein